MLANANGRRSACLADVSEFNSRRKRMEPKIVNVGGSEDIDELGKASLTEMVNDEGFGQDSTSSQFPGDLTREEWDQIR